MALQADLFDLGDRVAVVTGGSRGLGAAMVRAFAQRGAHVVIASRKAAACEALAKEVREETGRDALAVPCHVGRWEDCDALVDRAFEHFGRIDVLVNNAGMSPIASSSLETSEALYDKVFAVNLKGPFRLTALVGSRMAEGGGGSIINVSSTASIRPTPTTAPYAAAKAGVNAITVAYAHEFGPTVRVNCIMAGPFHTDVSKAWSRTEGFERQAKATMALGRAGNPDEVIGAALYFASDASSFTSGTVMRIDGGVP